MKKRIVSFVLVFLVALNAQTAFASAPQAEAPLQKDQVQRQIDALMLTVDKDTLIRDAKNNVIDASVPRTIRDQLSFGAELEFKDDTFNDRFSVDVNSTVQKVGDIICEDGETATLYVAATTSEIKEDSGAATELGVRAWTTVYWIDNQGVNNELSAVAAGWDTSDCRYETSNKMVTYGTTIPTGLLFDVYTIRYLDNGVTDYYATCGDGEFVGFTLACKSRIEIDGPYGATLNCWARSNMLT